MKVSLHAFYFSTCHVGAIFHMQSNLPWRSGKEKAVCGNDFFVRDTVWWIKHILDMNNIVLLHTSHERYSETF